MRVVALDLIRFLAAMSVVCYHYFARPETTIWPMMGAISQYGYLGVPLFFMISGYVIALSADHRSPLQFAISRFVRLYPALWMGVLVTCGVTLVLTDSQYTAAQILSNLTLLNDYMGQTDIDGVYWTLKVELKFYACIFLLLLFNVYQHFSLWLAIWLSLVISHMLFGQPYFIGWFISPEYSCYFMVGILLYLLNRHGLSALQFGMLVVASIIALVKGYQHATQFIIDAIEGQRWIAVVILCCMILMLLLLSLERLPLKARPSYVILGALTYPLYLIHNVAGKAWIDHFKSSIAEQWVIMGTLVMMLGLSWLIQRTVEQPVATGLKHWLLARTAKPAEHG